MKKLIKLSKQVIFYIIMNYKKTHCQSDQIFYVPTQIAIWMSPIREFLGNYLYTQYSIQKSSVSIFLVFRNQESETSAFRKLGIWNICFRIPGIWNTCFRNPGIWTMTFRIVSQPGFWCLKTGKNWNDCQSEYICTILFQRN